MDDKTVLDFLASCRVETNRSVGLLSRQIRLTDVICRGLAFVVVDEVIINIDIDVGGSIAAEIMNVRLWYLAVAIGVSFGGGVHYTTRGVDIISLLGLRVFRGVSMIGV